MSAHIIQVYSEKPFAASVPFGLMVCEDKMTVEAMKKALKRGKCAKGHRVVRK